MKTSTSSIPCQSIAKALLLVFAASGIAAFLTACSTPAQRQDARVESRVDNRVDRRHDRW